MRAMLRTATRLDGATSREDPGRAAVARAVVGLRPAPCAERESGSARKISGHPNHRDRASRLTSPWARRPQRAPLARSWTGFGDAEPVLQPRATFPRSVRPVHASTPEPARTRAALPPEGRAGDRVHHLLPPAPSRSGQAPHSPLGLPPGPRVPAAAHGGRILADVAPSAATPSPEAQMRLCGRCTSWYAPGTASVLRPRLCFHRSTVQCMQRLGSLPRPCAHRVVAARVTVHAGPLRMAADGGSAIVGIRVPRAELDSGGTGARCHGVPAHPGWVHRPPVGPVGCAARRFIQRQQRPHGDEQDSRTV